MTQSTHLPDFRSCKVLVAGDIMLDRYWAGVADRVSPEAPVPVVLVNDKEDRAGGAANVALGVIALGSSAGIVGLVGRDEAALALRDTLSHSSLTPYLVAEERRSTTVKLRVLSKHQQLLRLDFEEAAPAERANELKQVISDVITQYDVLVLSDYAKGALDDMPALIDQARAAGVPVIVDPKRYDPACFTGATVLTPNQFEFEKMVGACPDEHAMVAAARSLMVDHRIDAMLITRSEAGMLLVTAEDALTVQAQARDVYDVTGAGDTVVAVLSVCMAAKMPLKQAVIWANRAAGVAVGKVGTAVVTSTELQSTVPLSDLANDKTICTPAELKAIVDRAKESGERIVFTNGCFDLLHAGHVTYLKQARQHGDRLIVALNSDESVKQLKGVGRPINSLNDRMQVIAGLRAVDWVVAFSESTPLTLIELLTPDVLVKGGDYDPDDIVGAEQVKHHGGDVVVMPFVDGCSTTSVINQIRLGAD